MKFWDFFKAMPEQEHEKLSRLHDKISHLLLETPALADKSQKEDDELIKIACLAGLLARVAYIDFDVDDEERKQMKKVLIDVVHLDKEEAYLVVDLAVDEIKDLSGLENHKYCHPLNNILDNQQKFDLVLALFSIAASDGEISELESEEIRLINKGLELEHQHYVAARVQYKKYLGVLNS
jgi:uncharacterized tellurite resistance protein B-like protein